MKIKLGWADGEEKTLSEVSAFQRSWHSDEYVVKVEYRSGTVDTFTGKNLAVFSGEGGES